MSRLTKSLVHNGHMTYIVPALLLVKDILKDEGRFINAYRMCLLQIKRNTKFGMKPESN